MNSTRSRKRPRNHKWRDENGAIRFEHYKKADGTWGYRHRPTNPLACLEHPDSPPGHWCYRKPAIADRLMWKHAALLKGLAAGEPCYWCEGEKDANSASSAWDVIATSHHNGRGLAKRTQIELFTGSRSQINLVMDYDESGVYIAWNHARLLVQAGVLGTQIRFLWPAVHEIHADLTVHIREGHGLDALEEIGPAQVRKLYDEYCRRPMRRRGRAYGSGGKA